MYIVVLYVMFCFFFFFQAEDGIRDLTVTGVQTCALPIWSVNDPLTKGAGVRKSTDACAQVSSEPTFGLVTSENEADEFVALHSAQRLRSEERRVGKECRCRWLPQRDIRNRGRVRMAVG